MSVAVQVVDERVGSGSSSSVEPISLSSVPPPSRAIPTSWGSSVGAWWRHDAEKETSIAEERLLRRIPCFIPSADTPDPSPSASNPTPLVARVNETRIGYPGLSGPSTSTSSPASSTVSVKSSERKSSPNISVHYLHGVELYSVGEKGSKESRKGVNVLLHGYGASLGFFYRNLEAFGEVSASNGRRAFALDWLGMGLSSRPSPKAFDPPVGTKTEPPEAKVARAEAFFVDSLESWREQWGFETMTLVGHSLGGYLSIAYALKHPSRVDKLILVSPAGIPLSDEPANLQIPIVESVTSSGGPKPLAATLPSDVPSTPPASPIERVPERIPSPGPKLGARLFNWGWELGVSPFGLIRSFPILAPKIVGFYTSRRFVGQAEEDVRDANAYLYATMMLKGSGEYCIHSILKVGAVARQGMEGRMDGIKVPVRFIYGEKDWMQPSAAHLTAARLAAHGNDDVTVQIVPKAGHHIYLDNSTRFNEILKEELGA